MIYCKVLIFQLKESNEKLHRMSCKLKKINEIRRSKIKFL